MSASRAASMLLLALLLAGCVVLPTPEHGSTTNRPLIDENVVDSLQVGTATREDVLLRFGEPDVVLPRERVIGYSWDRIAAYFLWGGPQVGGVEALTRQHVLLLQFDERGVLVRAELKQGVMLEVWPTAVEWAGESGRPR